MLLNNQSDNFTILILDAGYIYRVPEVNNGFELP